MLMRMQRRRADPGPELATLSFYPAGAHGSSGVGERGTGGGGGGGGGASRGSSTGCWSPEPLPPVTLQQQQSPGGSIGDDSPSQARGGPAGRAELLGRSTGSSRGSSRRGGSRGGSKASPMLAGGSRGRPQRGVKPPPRRGKSSPPRLAATSGSSSSSSSSSSFSAATIRSIISSSNTSPGLDSDPLRTRQRRRRGLAGTSAFRGAPRPGTAGPELSLSVGSRARNTSRGDPLLRKRRDDQARKCLQASFFM